MRNLVAVLAILTAMSGCGESSDYRRGFDAGYRLPDQFNQKASIVGELTMDAGDEIGFTPTAPDESADYQRGLTDGYYKRRGEIDAAQSEVTSKRVDQALE